MSMNKDSVKILPIEEFRAPLERDEVYVNTLQEHLRLHHARVEKPHKHEFFAVMLFTAGSGTHTIDFTRYGVKPGSVFIMAPGQVHSWNLTKDVDGFVFFHTRSFYDRNALHEKTGGNISFSFNHYADAIILDKTGTEDFTKLVDHMLHEYQGNAFGKNQYIITLIQQAYLELARAFLRTDQPAENRQGIYYQKYLEFERLLEENFRTQKSASAYADLLHVSAKHLNRILQSVIGKSTSEAILNRVILEAQRMLIHSRKNLAEIADELGFDDYSYFSHVFKKKTGKSPSAFLKDI